MRFPAVRRRLPPKHPALRIHTLAPAPSVLGLDFSEAFTQLAWRELLAENGLRGKV